MITSIVISFDQPTEDEGARLKALDLIVERIRKGYKSGQDCIGVCCYEFNVD